MISLNWLKDYIDLDNTDPHKLALDITNGGINVEKVISKYIPHIVIGEVLESIPHPDSDHLHVCQVNIGKSVEQIVCGAPNVRKGLKVIVALPGAILPPDFEIKSSKIRGVESNGMLCALFELGVVPKTDEEYNKGIYEVDEKEEVGKDANIILGLDDTLYELDIHKHRNNDCYSHIAFAYEVATILNKKISLPEDKYKVINDNINNYLQLDVTTSKCPYYLGKMVKNVKIKETPTFIKKRLESVGIHSINNIVDISNYVMLEYGQPLHFFDQEEVGSKVLVREAIENETLVTLNNEEQKLTKGDIIITDGKKPICLAGIMGGLNTEITSKTKNIFIESAIFDGPSIRLTSQRLGIPTEASIRYGKGLNYEYTNKAIDRACYLLEKYADGEVLDGILTHDKLIKETKEVSFSTTDIVNMLGINISTKDIESILIRLNFEYENKNDNFKVTIPPRRIDIDPNINDIAEEIIRLYGYDKLTSNYPKVDLRKGGYEHQLKLRKDISKRMRYLGLDEVMNYTLIDEKNAQLYNYEKKELLHLPNPMSIDKEYVRTSLISSLINTYNYNKARKVDNIAIYEIAKTYDNNYQEDVKLSFLMSGNYLNNSWQNKYSQVDFYLIKGIIVNILDYLGFKNRYYFKKENIEFMHPGITAGIYLDREMIGIIGRINPTINKDEVYICEVSINKLDKETKNIKYVKASLYPEIKKDVAFIVDKDITSSDIQDTIKRNGEHILSNIEVFDVYEGEKMLPLKKSIAYSLTFKDNTRTLTDEEVMIVFNKIINAVKDKFNADIRDK